MIKRGRKVGILPAKCYPKTANQHDYTHKEKVAIAREECDPERVTEG
jgi:hypothetical protein